MNSSPKARQFTDLAWLVVEEQIDRLTYVSLPQGKIGNMATVLPHVNTGCYSNNDLQVSVIITIALYIFTYFIQYRFYCNKTTTTNGHIL